jgi:uncharacterized protein (TIGR02453 family)
MSHLSPEMLKFLRDLRKNNNREWFQDNRQRYEAAQGEFVDFVALLIQEIGKFDASVTRVRPKDAVFRIFKDVRFSKDKSPYKTNFGASICEGGRKARRAVYYLHVEPGDHSMTAGGLYHPPNDWLGRVRERIAADPSAFEKLLKAASFKKLYPALWDEDRLKTVPRGYAKDHPAAELLKYKSFIVSSPLSDAELLAGDLLKTLRARFKVLQPLNDYLNQALGS